VGNLVVRAVQTGDWPLIEQLFGPRGACGGCWCMHWHAPPGAAAWELMKGEPNRTALKAMMDGGNCPAVIAIERGKPVGWCRLGPAEAFEKLRRSRKLWRDGIADWVIVCFFVAASHRGRGVSTRLLKEATELAFASGARSVEGYPGVPRSGRMPAAFAWTGVPAIFEAVGFKPLPVDAGARRIYRLERRA
jgi:GNAT superfamily N-acetyltransferase